MPGGFKKIFGQKNFGLSFRSLERGWFSKCHLVVLVVSVILVVPT